ncbi:MAG: PqqD family peptide modification chaperone [Prevotellaceae bacterium]|jgi:hypothetical protein|nr:PqqD family peptide modification chaperone [Prevotellaceae bacterium]
MRIKKGIKLRNIAGENVVIMQGRTGADMTKIVSFNTTAEWLWNKLYDKEFSIEDIAGLLSGNFKVDKAAAESDAKAWVKKLSDCKILEA